SGIAVPADENAMKRLASELIAKRSAEGNWDGPKGKVIETARAALALSEVYAKTNPGSNAAPVSVKRLPKLEEADRTKALAALNQGALFLVSKSKNGLFEGRPGEPNAGLTAMA